MTLEDEPLNPSERSGYEPTPPSQRSARLKKRPTARPPTWSRSVSAQTRAEQILMGGYYYNHDFLARPHSSAGDEGDKAALIFVNNGTTPDAIAERTLRLTAKNRSPLSPLHITWYSQGALLPGTLFRFREEHFPFSASAHLHLFPGPVDLQLQAMISPEAVRYARNLGNRTVFSCMILGAFAFDLNCGVLRYCFEREVPIQVACALMKARVKLLFLSPNKFDGPGVAAYSLRDLFATTDTVIVYTVSSPRDAEIAKAFQLFAADLFEKAPRRSDEAKEKYLRLTIVGQGSAGLQVLPFHGCLKKRWRRVPPLVASSGGLLRRNHTREASVSQRANPDSGRP